MALAIGIYHLTALDGQPIEVKKKTLKTLIFFEIRIQSFIQTWLDYTYFALPAVFTCIMLIYKYEPYSIPRWSDCCLSERIHNCIEEFEWTIT